MIRPLLSSFAALSIVMAPLTDARAACYTQAEAAAVQVRMLQSELMVAALACRDSNPELGMVAEYNSFMRRFGDRLAGHSRALQAHFNKNYGQEARRRHDSFITSLANGASKRSMSVSGFCSDSATLFRSVAVLENRDLERFSATRAVETGEPIAACGSAEGTISRR